MASLEQQQQNLALLADSAFEERGDHRTLLYEGRWFSSGELHGRASRLAGGLIARGVRPGDRVAVSMANCPEVGITYNAVWRAGAVVTPAMFLLPVEDLGHVLRDSGARALITTPEFAAKCLEASAGTEVQFVACAGEAEGTVPLAELEAADPVDPVMRDADELAALLYTGGTTGRSKGVMLTHSALAFTGRAGHEASFVEGLNRAIVPLPLSHAYGILLTVAGLHNPQRVTTVLQRWFDPDGFLALIQEHGIQQAAVVPTMLQILLGKDLESYDLCTLRYVTSGGAALAPEVQDAFCARVPSVTIRQGYGLTETAALIATNPVGRERRGTVGLPVPGVELRITDDDGNPLARGEVGEICCKSPGVMKGYWNSPEVTAEAIRDGWLHTGDVGVLDEEGYLHIVDRKKDLIIRGGFNVYPRDVEDALVGHPSVAMAGVVGRADERLGEEVVAFVELAADCEPVDGETLVTWARERIGGYKYPREVHIIDAVPLTPVGKIDRKALRARLA